MLQLLLDTSSSYQKIKQHEPVCHDILIVAGAAPPHLFVPCCSRLLRLYPQEAGSSRQGAERASFGCRPALVQAAQPPPLLQAARGAAPAWGPHASAACHVYRKFSRRTISGTSGEASGCCVGKRERQMKGIGMKKTVAGRRGM